MIFIQHTNIDYQITIRSDVRYNIVIENPFFYREFVSGLKEQIDEDVSYVHIYKDMKEVSLSKYVFLISDLNNVQMDDKKIASYIQKDVGSHLTDEQKSTFQNIVNTIDEYVESVSCLYQVPLQFDSDISFTSFFKALSLTSNYQGKNYLETLILKILNIRLMTKTDILIFVNLHDFLSEEEFLLFDKEMMSNEIDYLIVSSHLPVSKPSKEFIIRIDNDLCELHIDNDEPIS